MSEPLNNPLDGTQPNTGDTTTVQTQTNVVPEEQYKNLQSDYTKRVESEIALAAKLVNASPQELKQIEDIRVQNAVAKQLYGMDYPTLIAVRGENFFKTSDEENLDKTEMLEREVKLMKYQRETENLENALDEFYTQNKNIVATDADKEKLKNELKYISSELPPKERIRRASAVAFGILPNENQVYKNIAVGTSTNGGNGSMTQMNNDTEFEKQMEAGRKLFGLK